MVRLSKKERQDKLELLASINQVNVGAAQNEDNGKSLLRSLPSWRAFIFGLTTNDDEVLFCGYFRRTRTGVYVCTHAYCLF